LLEPTSILTTRKPTPADFFGTRPGVYDITDLIGEGGIFGVLPYEG
jgi:hypothetical protein